MSLPLTCACGARLEIDEKFAGQAITCPDCQKALQVPASASQQTGRVTSGWAITSLVLALVGAFTVVGTLLAIGCGMVALRQIARQPDRLGGRNYARGGILLGSVLTVVSLILYMGAEWVGLDALLREPEWAGRLDYSGPLQLTANAFSVTLPSRAWGLLRQAANKNDNADPLEDSRIFVNVRDDAYVLCNYWVLLRPEDNLQDNQKLALDKLRQELPKLTKKVAVSEPAVESAKVLAAPEGKERTEMVVNVAAGGQRRKFLLRLDIHRDKLCMIAAGTRVHRYDRLLPQLREIIEGFEVK
jgi:hypothetical protein